MGNAEQPVLIYTTFGNLEEAKEVGAALVAARLAACVNMFPGMISLYQWDGAREEAHGSCAPLARRSRCLRRRSRPAQHGRAGGGASRAREGGFSDALGRLCSTTR